MLHRTCADRPGVVEKHDKRHTQSNAVSERNTGLQIPFATIDEKNSENCCPNKPKYSNTFQKQSQTHSAVKALIPQQLWYSLLANVIWVFIVDSGNPLTSPLVPQRDWWLWFFMRYFNNYWVRHSWCQENSYLSEDTLSIPWLFLSCHHDVDIPDFQRNTSTATGKSLVQTSYWLAIWIQIVENVGNPLIFCIVPTCMLYTLVYHHKRAKWMLFLWLLPKWRTSWTLYLLNIGMLALSLWAC